MPNRREFIKTTGALGLLGATGMGAANPPAQNAPAATGADDRAYWVSVMEKLAFPVLDHLSRRELKKTMPVEAANAADRTYYTHLQALGRLLAGIAPWLETSGLDAAELTRQHHYIDLALASLDAATDPGSPDFLTFSRGDQALVDSAFLAQGLLRAPMALLEALTPAVITTVSSFTRCWWTRWPSCAKWMSDSSRPGMWFCGAHNALRKCRNG